MRNPLKYLSRSKVVWEQDPETHITKHADKELNV